MTVNRYHLSFIQVLSWCYSWCECTIYQWNRVNNSHFILQVACVQLINAIVSQPDDLDFRLHLRNEFMRTGMIDALEVRCPVLLMQWLSGRREYRPSPGTHSRQCDAAGVSVIHTTLDVIVNSRLKYQWQYKLAKQIGRTACVTAMVFINMPFWPELDIVLHTLA